MRLMTIGADLMALGCTLLLGTMAVGAGRGLRSGMRFVAANATGVTRLDQGCLLLMAIGARDFVGLGLVR
jgi:hypothetical protein